METPNIILVTDDSDSQFIFVAEHENPALIQGDDPLGFHVDSLDAVAQLLARAQSWQASDPRVEIRLLDDLDFEQTLTRAFYVRFCSLTGSTYNTS